MNNTKIQYDKTKYFSVVISILLVVVAVILIVSFPNYENVPLWMRRDFRENYDEIVVIWSAAVIGLIIASCVFLLRYRAMCNVEKYSNKYKKIISLIEEYSFTEYLSSLIYTKNVESRKEYNRFDPDFYLYEVLRDDYQNICETYHKYVEYSQRYEEYQNKLSEIKSEYCTEYAKEAKVGLKRFIKYEILLISSYGIEKPYDDKMIFCNVIYASPKGRRHLHSGKGFTSDEVKSAMDSLPEYSKRMSFANPQYERSLMSDSLRYDILKRDGFKCQICGMSQKDGVRLHVDHIIPVTRGGRTIPSNLRTLCEACNKGKSDKYDVNGVN